MICSVLGRKGFGHTIELQRETLECMFGTIIPCMTGAGVRAQLDSLVANADGGFEGYGQQHAWAQKSGLWRLPYMQDLLLPRNIDMMHSEKNVAEALFGTIMDIVEKTKDNVKARVDQ